MVGGEDLVFHTEVAALRNVLGKDNVLTYSVSNDQLSVISLALNVFFSLSTFFKIRRIIKDHKIELVHVHNFFPLISPSVFFAAKSLRVKTVQTLHNFRNWCIAGTFYREKFGACELCSRKLFSFSSIRYKCYRKSYFQSLVAEAAFTFYKLLNTDKKVDQYFVLTPFQKSKLLEIGISAEKISLKPNAATFDTPVLLERKGFVFIGRFEEGKGLQIVLETWKNLKQSAHLKIIGNGPEFDKLRTEYESDLINFLGTLERADVLNELKRAKFLIHASLYYETFGLTILESLSQSTPVIGFDIGTRPNFIKNGVNGFLCKPSIDALAETVEKALSLSNYDQMQVEAIKSAEPYQTFRVINYQVQLYQKLLGTKV